MATLTATCSPTIVSRHALSAQLRQPVTMAYTLKELLSMDAQQLQSVCERMNIYPSSTDPSHKHTREALFYHVVATLSARNQIVDTRTPTKPPTESPATDAVATTGQAKPAASPDTAINGHMGADSPHPPVIHRDISIQELKILEAIEFTQKVDDGANPDMWPEADLVLLGVSRSGKTPLSMFLAAQGYKVANCPLVQGVSVPDSLFDFDQSRVVALVLDPDVLVSIRKKRAAMMGLNERSAAYVNVERIEDELAWVKSMYRQHPQWTLLDVTFRGVEETASKILKAMHQKHPTRFQPTLNSSPTGA